MVFPSLPLYLDPPNWQQQHLNQNQQQTNDTNENQHLLRQQQHHPIPLQLPPQPNGNPLGGGSGSIDGGVGGNDGAINANMMRPNSMAERARLAKIAQPDGPLKCPRCDSSNTKFCYFNNYSLTQPRHFCKTCRRYWTRGGALRSVPVGGGCRRNKRSKASNSSKSNTCSSGGGSGNIGINNTTVAAAGTNDGMIMSEKYNSSGPVDSLSGHLSSTPQLSFMASLQNITQLGMGNLGINFPAGLQLHHQLANNRTSPSNNMDQFGTSSTSSSPLLSSMQQQQQTHHQFPFMAGFHDQVIPPSAAAAHGLYHQFQNEEVPVEANTSNYGGGGSQNHHELMMMMMGSKSTTSSSASQNAPVKMEENFHKKLLLGMSGADDQNNNNNHHHFWYNGNGGGAAAGGNNNVTSNMWTDLSGLNSSSTTNLL